MVVPAVVTTIYAVHLAFVIYNRHYHKLITARHKKGLPGYEIYMKIYTPRYFACTVGVSLLFFIWACT